MNEGERICDQCGMPAGTNEACGQCVVHPKRTITIEAQALATRVQSLAGRVGVAQPEPPSVDGASLVERGSGAVHRLVNTVATVGRDRACDVVIGTDPCISRQHAVIALIDGVYFLEDLGSTNGTALNGKAVTDRKELRPGDRVTFGKTEMTFEMAPTTTALDHYELLSQLGRGGMGVVYKARDKRNDRILAIKQLMLEQVDPSRHKYLRDRFKREAMTAARLNHPNIVTVFHVETNRDNCYYTMEFLEGHSLGRELELRGGRLSPEEFLPILQQVCEGLAYAHSMRVVHRDIKPDNIFIRRDGRVKVTDFGIAAVLDVEQTNMTVSGSLLGTPAYVSPEQIQEPRHVDHRADIFSLGVVAYEALAGQTPFRSDSIAGLAMQIVSEDPPPLMEVAAGLSPALNAVVLKSLRKKARERYPSALDLLWDYKRALLPESTVGGGGRVVTPVDTFLLPELNQRFAASQLRQEQAAAAAAAASDRNTPAGAEVTIPSSPIVARLVNPVGVIGGSAADNRLTDPAALCCGMGLLVVCDAATRQVMIFGKDGTWQANLDFPTGPQARILGIKGLSRPGGLTMDLHGRIFVSEMESHLVDVFESSGQFLREFSNPAGKDRGIHSMAVDGSGDLYLSDPANRCVQVVNADTGEHVLALGPAAADGILMQMPAWIASDPRNHIYAVDFGNSTVVVFEPDGTHVRSFEINATVPGGFCAPGGVAVDGNGLIYVSDSLNNRVLVFGSEGYFLYSFGSTGVAPGQFIQPAGMCIEHKTNTLYVADRGNHRIQVFELRQH